MGGKIRRPQREVDLIASHIRDVPNFPLPGIVFKDITPLLAQPRALREAINLMAEAAHGYEVDAVIAIESRGFIFGAPMARRLNLPLQLVRKPGKLPYKTAGVDYQLEYGTDRVEIHVDAVERGKNYMIVDDLLATGGTAEAAARLIEQQGGHVACLSFLIELGFLEGRHRLAGRPVHAVLEY